MQRPFEISAELFPFESKWTQIDGIDIHYLDEGRGETILFCHGNPTWSLLYTEIIKRLKGHYRCIVIDYPGFGMSAKPSHPDYPYTPGAHSAILAKFVDMMELTKNKLSFFVQDWGGPIGLNVACDMADSVERLFIGNTWAWPFDPSTEVGQSAGAFSKKMGADEMKSKIMEKNSFLMISMPMLLRGIGKQRPAELRAQLKQAYLAPFATPESRIPTWVFPRSILAETEFLAALEAKLPRILAKPTILFWGLKDIVFPEPVKKDWEGRLTNYRLVDLPEAAHFFQEEEAERIAQEILA